MPPKNLVMALLAWTGSAAWAAPFTITDRVNFNPALDAAADVIESQINDGFLSSAQTLPFLESMALAATSGTTMLMTDRVTRPKSFVIAIGAQAGFDGSASINDFASAGTNSLPPVGAGGQGAVVIGMPGTIFGKGKGASRWSLFLSGGGLSLTSSDVRFRMMNFGAAVQYQLVSEAGSPFLRWGGLRIGTGVGYAKGQVGYGGTLTESSGSVSVTMNMDLNVETSNVVVPLELATTLQVFYLAQVYGGGAVDFNFGSSRFAGISSGPVETGVPGSTATAQLNLDDGSRGKTNTAALRAFAGVQVNLWVIRAGVEYAVLSKSLESLGAYVKIGL